MRLLLYLEIKPSSKMTPSKQPPSLPRLSALAALPRMTPSGPSALISDHWQVTPHRDLAVAFERCRTVIEDERHCCSASPRSVRKLLEIIIASGLAEVRPEFIIALISLF